MVDRLIRLEGKLRRARLVPAVSAGANDVIPGLRGGSVVLMVGAFEKFLKDLLVECLSRGATRYQRFKFDRLPDKLRVHAVFGTLEREIKPPPVLNRPRERVHRISYVLQACEAVLQKKVVGEVFTDLGGNPSSRVVRDSLKNVGMDDAFTLAKAAFEKGWGSAVATTFINDKLDEIVHKRHEVAHASYVLNVTPQDLRAYLKFLRVLGQVLESQVRTHVNKVFKQAV